MNVLQKPWTFHQQRGQQPREGMAGRRIMRHVWLILVCTVSSHFILTSLYVPSSATTSLLLLGNTTASNESPRSVHKKFELFSLSSIGEEDQRLNDISRHHTAAKDKSIALVAPGTRRDEAVHVSPPNTTIEEKMEEHQSSERHDDNEQNQISIQQREGNATPTNSSESQHPFFGVASPDDDSEQALDLTQVFMFSSWACEGNETAHNGTTGEAFTFTPVSTPKSLRILGGGVLEFDRVFGDQRQYLGTVMETEGCVDLPNDKTHLQFTLYPTNRSSVNLMSNQQIPDTLQQQFSTAQTRAQPHVRIVYSATSSDYFGYQLLANAMGFLQSNQTNASWTRLLTSQLPDDLSERFPTFTAPKSLYSNEYVPINKADVIDKWMHSQDAPHPDDIVVVIDPDNWLLKDVHPWTLHVSPKQVVGQLAYYGSDPRINNIWKAICLENCDTKVDPVGVPYFVKASDLKEIAPLWRQYSIMIHKKMQTDSLWKKKYDSLGIQWAAEMVGFNAASTHLGIKTKVIESLQVRDISSTLDWAHWSNMPMIHMGRAWFPESAKEQAEQWRSADDGGFARKGIQVWCKCNRTAAKVQPWPLPDGLDFVSYHTLRLIHESVEHFGPVPVNETFRREDNPYLAPI